MVFWRAVVASIVAGVPLAILQGALEAVLADVFNMTGEVTVVVSIVVTALFGAPLAYMLAGVVLGDVDPFEATAPVVPRLPRPQDRRGRRGPGRDDAPAC